MTYPKAYRGTTAYVRVMAELIHAAEYGGLTTYQHIALLMALPTKFSIMASKTGKILGEISEDEVKNDRPMLSAVCVNVEGKPGPGFIAWARKLGRAGQNDDASTFWERERDAVYVAWKRPLPE